MKAQKPPSRPNLSPIRPSASMPPTERHHDRDGGDGQVVIELADRLDEGPAIGADHEDAVGGVDQRHAGGEQRREDQMAPRRHALRACAAAMPSRPTSVAVSKPRPNRKPSGYMCQLASDHPEQRPEHAASKPRWTARVEVRRRAAAGADAPGTLRQTHSGPRGWRRDGEQENSAETEVPMTPPRLERHRSAVCSARR